MEVAFQNLFGVGSDRGGFQAFSTSRLQLIQHNFAKGRPSGAPGFLARAKFLTFAIFERVPNLTNPLILNNSKMPEFWSPARDDVANRMMAS